MGKKMMNFPFLSNQTDHHHNSNNNNNSPLWPWPSCTQARTLSFRAAMTAEDVAVNASSSSVDPDEAVIRGLRTSDSERLVFVEPGETSSILEEAHKQTLTLDEDEDESAVPFKESVALSMESRNPYLDFKASMQEMVEAHGIKEWDSLEELLCWYLKVNGKDNHGYVIAAFVDVLVGLAFDITAKANNPRCFDCESPYSPLSFCNTSSSSSASSSSISSSSSTPNCVPSSVLRVSNDQEIETSCLSSLLESTEEEINEDDDDDDDVSS